MYIIDWTIFSSWVTALGTWALVIVTFILIKRQIETAHKQMTAQIDSYADPP
jgi:hypothetical protein